MMTITISLSDEQWAQLREFAQLANIPPEELTRIAVEEWLRQPRDDFTQSARHVLHKNAELYRRLA